MGWCVCVHRPPPSRVRCPDGALSGILILGGSPSPTYQLLAGVLWVLVTNASQ